LPLLASDTLQVAAQVIGVAQVLQAVTVGGRPAQQLLQTELLLDPFCYDGSAKTAHQEHIVPFPVFSIKVKTLGFFNTKPG
jgi:hypothetical protein